MFEEITFQIGSYESFPIMQTLSADEQRDFVESGYGTVDDLIDINIRSQRDWQCDC